jgi:hypothetical protein
VPQGVETVAVRHDRLTFGVLCARIDGHPKLDL